MVTRDEMSMKIRHIIAFKMTKTVIILFFPVLIAYRLAKMSRSLLALRLIINDVLVDKDK